MGALEIPDMIYDMMIWYRLVPAHCYPWQHLLRHGQYRTIYYGPKRYRGILGSKWTDLITYSTKQNVTEIWHKSLSTTLENYHSDLVKCRIRSSDRRYIVSQKLDGFENSQLLGYDNSRQGMLYKLLGLWSSAWHILPAFFVAVKSQ